MHPRPIPSKLIKQNIGTPMKFGAPPGMEDEVGDLELLNLAHPAQLRALLKGEPPPHPPGSKDFWVSWWEPSEAEIRQIQKGTPIRLTIHGATQINPVSIEVTAGVDDLLHEETQN